MMRCLVIVALLAAPAAQAQHAVVTFTGLITDATSGEVLPGAHVAVASSLSGTTSSHDGRYRLVTTSGATRLIVSMVGYETVTADTLVSAGSSLELDFSLEPRVIELGGIDVSAERPRRWSARLRRFERLFLGESELGDRTMMLNAEVLDFEGGIGRLRAVAKDPLVIDNRGLGYRITYHLREFERSGGTVRWDGDPFFEELEPRDDTERARWPVERCRTYFGSFRHFVLALIDESAWDQGFRIGTRFSLDAMQRSTPFRIRESRLVHPGDTPESRELRWGGYLEVEYIHALESEAYLRWEGRGLHARPLTQRSSIRVSRRPAIVDREGEVADPYALTLYGYFAFTRIADLLPKEYRPPKHVRHPQDCASIHFARDAKRQASEGLISDRLDIMSRSIVHSSAK